MEDIQRVKRPSSYYHAWIGLADYTLSWKNGMSNDLNSWRWSATGNTSPGGYNGPWETGEPNFDNGNSTCVMMRYGKWSDTDCSHSYYFVCFRGSLQPGLKEFIFVELARPWSEAVTYCRENYVDLAVIEDASESTTVSNMIGTSWVWIGLYRQPFRWSDNRISSFTNWEFGQPDNNQTTEACVRESSAAEHWWSDAACVSSHRVICERAIKRTTLVKFVLRSAADLSNPVTNAQIPNKVTFVVSVAFRLYEDLQTDSFT
ncbi:hypothetical protein WMY93_026999 [Mugilogobius chulae]|uniref:C-type lectin domain-containing protein n=1 Tax=Mugilogobius chulae TaxID=88201 RepID=A0AAW0MTH0_9GOBI